LASRVAGEWLAATGAAEIVVATHPAWADPHGTASLLLAVDPAAQVAAWVDELDLADSPAPSRWRSRWTELGRLARQAMEEALASEGGPTEPGIAQALVDALPEGAQLVASSSMPIRDLEWCV